MKLEDTITTSKMENHKQKKKKNKILKFWDIFRQENEMKSYTFKRWEKEKKKKIEHNLDLSNYWILDVTHLL